MRKIAIVIILLSLVVIGAFFILFDEKKLEIYSSIPADADNKPENIKNDNYDIESQKPLANPPEIIKAVYLTSWSAASPEKLNYIIGLADKTEINAVVIDIKDYSGYVAYDINLESVKKYETKEVRIKKINSLIKKLHDKNIYVIARTTVFQDPALGKTRPDLAISSRAKKSLWTDNNGLSWTDPASKEVWDYNIAIAKDAASRGFDEINFDYIRFPSDGNLNDMDFPFWDEKIPMSEILRRFFEYLRNQTLGIKISADLFGLSTVQSDDLGIGQIIENAYAYFDYVAPMVYPSHYASGFLNYKNPADYPYEVVKYSMESAARKLKNYENASGPIIHVSKLRPWLQDFDLGADYDSKMVKAQIRAVEDLNGWMLWNPKNIYTIEALEVE